MATRVPYCEEKDLLLGDMQVPRTVSKAEWIQSAADEMDAWIGQVYVIPIPLDPMDSAHQADILLLKKINQFLATGRIIVASNAAHQDNRLHAYGQQLIDDARQELARITAGRTLLEAAEPLVQVEMRKSPLLITHRDETSYVDAFYGSSGTSHTTGREFFS